MTKTASSKPAPALAQIIADGAQSDNPFIKLFSEIHLWKQENAQAEQAAPAATLPAECTTYAVHEDGTYDWSPIDSISYTQEWFGEASSDPTRAGTAADAASQILRTILDIANGLASNAADRAAFAIRDERDVSYIRDVLYRIVGGACSEASIAAAVAAGDD